MDILSNATGFNYNLTGTVLILNLSLANFDLSIMGAET